MPYENIAAFTAKLSGTCLSASVLLSENALPDEVFQIS